MQPIINALFLGASAIDEGSAVLCVQSVCATTHGFAAGVKEFAGS